MAQEKLYRFLQGPHDGSAGGGAQPIDPNHRGARAVPQVVIVGGGFAGLYAAQSLRRAPVQITLIDRRNFHLFQPLLYQVATGGLSPANIAAPLRSVLRRQRNTTVLLGDVVDIDPQHRRVILRTGEIPYDTLIVCTGSQTGYFGHDDWQQHAPGLKTVEDAIHIRARVLSAFEAAELETDPARIRVLLTFVIVGGGPTGVELAGALAEIARDTLKHDFRRIDPSQASILLVERSPRILEHYPPELSAAAVRSLNRLGVTVRTGTSITQLAPNRVTLESNGQTEEVAAGTILWAAGVVASPLGKVLQQRTGAELDRVGRVTVAPDLSLPGHPDIFVIGDLARVSHDGQPLPGLATVAIQQGRYMARLIQARLRGHPVAPFRYHDKGDLATIGRAAAVADLRFVRFSGYPAWVVWLFVHLMYLVEFENRLLVLLQWAYNYFTRNRPARLITEQVPIDGAPPTSPPAESSQSHAQPVSEHATMMR
jgi:NADH:ubiquinone reductase (H+-translocating)